MKFRMGIVAVLGLFAGLHAQAQAPELINYQARLTVAIRLYEGELEVKSTYAETQTVVVVDGMLSFDIGASSASSGLLSLAIEREAWVELASLETDKAAANMADIAVLSNQVAAVKRFEAGLPQSTTCCRDPAAP